MSRLEKFINENRSEFDDTLPPDAVWQKVEAAVLPKTTKNVRSGRFIQWAAAAAILVMVSAIVFLLLDRKETAGTAGTAGKNAPAPDSINLSAEEGLEMNQFARIIAIKQAELKILSKEQPKLYEKFTTAITRLDSSYDTLRTQLSVTPNRELMMEAMIQNLQLQLRVLNQQLSIIKQIKQSKKVSHEKNKLFT